MAAVSLNLAIVLSLIEQSVEAYRVLLREHPLDWGEEATQRQQEAADLLDRAQSLGGALGGEEWTVFTESFSGAVGVIERLETLRATIGYDSEADEDIDVEGGPSLVIRLVGGPLNGQTRNLDSSSPGEGVSGTAPRSIQLPHITEREVSMVTYLRDSEPSRCEWTYFYVDPGDVARSLEEASIAMVSPSARLSEALAHLNDAVRELKKETDTGLQAGLVALNDGILIAQNELSSTEQDVFNRRRRPVQALANEMEDRSAFDPDWRHL